MPSYMAKNRAGIAACRRGMQAGACSFQGMWDNARFNALDRKSREHREWEQARRREREWHLELEGRAIERGRALRHHRALNPAYQGWEDVGGEGYTGVRKVYHEAGGYPRLVLSEKRVYTDAAAFLGAVQPLLYQQEVVREYPQFFAGKSYHVSGKWLVQFENFDGRADSRRGLAPMVFTFRPETPEQGKIPKAARKRIRRYHRDLKMSGKKAFREEKRDVRRKYKEVKEEE